MGKPSTGSSRRSFSEKVSSSLERLEDRIAPAAVVLNNPGNVAAPENTLAEGIKFVSLPSDIPPLSQMDLSARIMMVITSNGIVNNSNDLAGAPAILAGPVGGLPIIGKNMVEVSNPSEVLPLFSQSPNARVLFLVGNGGSNVIPGVSYETGGLQSVSPETVGGLTSLGEGAVYVSHPSMILPLLKQNPGARVLYILDNSGIGNGLGGFPGMIEMVQHVDDLSEILPLLNENSGGRLFYVVAGAGEQENG